MAATAARGPAGESLRTDAPHLLAPEPSESLWYSLKCRVLGPPLVTGQLAGQRSASTPSRWTTAVAVAVALAALLGLGIPPGVRDRRAGRRRQRDRQLLVVGGELPARDPLGEIQVAFGLFIIVQTRAYTSTYKTQASRDQLARAYGSNTAMNALLGSERAVNTVAGFADWRFVGLLSVLGSIWGRPPRPRRAGARRVAAADRDGCLRIPGLVVSHRVRGRRDQHQPLANGHIRLLPHWPPPPPRLPTGRASRSSPASGSWEPSSAASSSAVATRRTHNPA
jgi:hypothetical protein